MGPTIIASDPRPPSRLRQDGACPHLVVSAFQSSPKSQGCLDVNVEGRTVATALHDLGECEVKHGVRVSVVKLYTDELGNAEVPEKFRQSKATSDANPLDDHAQ